MKYKTLIYLVPISTKACMELYVLFGKVLSTYWTYFLSEKRNVQVLKIYTLFIKIKCYFKVNINIVITSRKTLERDKFLKACL
jgi:hypothetical protein